MSSRFGSGIWSFAFAWLLPPTAAVLAFALVRAANGLDLMRARNDA